MSKQNKKLNQLLEKAKDSGLLAISIYNDPKTSFRTSGFLVMICIAWTSLLHASFEKDKIKYYYTDIEKTKPTRIRYKKIDGENKAWELPTCIKKTFSSEDAIFKNLDFVYKLRNKIEHRFLPQIDSEVLGECQACVLNFERFLVTQFGLKNSIVGEFSVPLQMTSGIRKLPELGKNEIIDFINTYRSSLSDELKDNQNFTTKFFLIPKIGNHKNSSDYAFEYIDTRNFTDEENQNIKKFLVGIRVKTVEVEKIKYLPGQIVSKIQELGYSSFTINKHYQLWKQYDAQNEDKKFGIPVAGKWHWYQEWLDFVIGQMNTQT